MKTKWSHVFFTILCLGLIGFFGLVILMVFTGEWIIQILWALVSGWATYPFRILPQANYNIEMILCGFIALALAMYFAHRFLRWLAEQVSALPTPWIFNYTACLSFLLLSMFGTSIAMTGIIHQTAWLASSDKITLTRRSGDTILQRSEAKSLLLSLYALDFDNDGSEQRFCATFSEALVRHSDEDMELNVFCRYSEGGLVPWLYPGAGRTADFKNSFPVIVSPFPNSANRIVVGYSDFSTESYPFDELPSEIAAFFE